MNGKTKEAEDKIRDILNLVAVYNNEEEDGEGKKLDDDAAKELKKKLQELSKIVGKL